MTRVWERLAAAALLLLASAAAADAAGVACVPLGGYPFVPGGCLNAVDLDRAIESSWSATPPTNAQGKGAGIGKWWVDTSTGSTTPHLRQCVNPIGCSPTYTSTDWLDWGTYNTSTRSFSLSTSVSPQVVGATYPLLFSNQTLSLLYGSEFVVSSNALHIANGGLIGAMFSSTALATGFGNVGGSGLAQFSAGVPSIGPATAAEMLALPNGKVYLGNVSNQPAPSTALPDGFTYGTTAKFTGTGTQAVTAAETDWAASSPGASITFNLPTTPVDHDCRTFINNTQQFTFPMIISGNGKNIGPSTDTSISAFAPSPVKLCYSVASGYWNQSL